MRVIQILPTLGWGDAVGNDTRAIHRILKEEGYDSVIAAEAVDARIPKEEATEIGKLPEIPWQYFCAIPDIQFTGIKYVDGKGERYMGWAVIIRAVNTVDAVSATVPEIPFSVLCRIRDRIIQTVDGVNRVLWDISEKPVATIEFE